MFACCAPYMVLWVILMASNEDIIKELERCGGQYAVANRYRHPSLAPLITSGRGRGVFDVRKVVDMLQSTLSFVETCGSKGQVILFVATRQETVDLVNRTAQNLSLPFMLHRWIGGTLSNYKNIFGRVERLQRLRKEKEDGAWATNTKKEKVLMNRELTKLESRFSGIVSLEELPAAVFILDTKKENNAVVEANSIGIPVIGLSNANADIGLIQHPIIANIQSREAVTYILGLVEEAYLSGVRKKKRDGDKKDSKDSKEVSRAAH